MVDEGKNKENKFNEKNLGLILTRREIEVLNKRLKNQKLTQQDSNYLSKFIRPKLREINSINAELLLNNLEYNQKALSIEERIKKVLLREIKNVNSITLYGSAIQNNWKNYNDIDVLVVVERRFWKTLGDKYREIAEIKNIFKKYDINLDLEIYDKKTFEGSYSSNISLIYQLKDRRVIYGKLKLPLKIEIPKLELRMKIDYSIPEESYTGQEIYRAIRNLILIKLLMQKIVDNRELIRFSNQEIGENLLNKLKKNQESKIERKIALLHLQRLLKLILYELNRAKWGKIVLLSH